MRRLGIAQVGDLVGAVSVERCFDGERRTIAGDASRGATPRGRCIPRGHPISRGPAHYGTDEIALDRLVGRAATLDDQPRGRRSPGRGEDTGVGGARPH